MIKATWSVHGIIPSTGNKRTTPDADIHRLAISHWRQKTEDHVLMIKALSIKAWFTNNVSKKKGGAQTSPPPWSAKVRFLLPTMHYNGIFERLIKIPFVFSWENMKVEIIRRGNCTNCVTFRPFSWWPEIKMRQRRAVKNIQVDNYTNESHKGFEQLLFFLRLTPCPSLLETLVKRTFNFLESFNCKPCDSD